MSTIISPRLNEVLTRLAPEQLGQVIDFAEFLAERAGRSVQERPADDADRVNLIDAMCGKYRDALGSSDEFARRKADEMTLEERRWQP